MIDYTQAFWLAVVQGATEFLPVSSAGHLALLPALFGWPDQGLAFDVAVHLGSLLAVVGYFRRDLAALLRAAPEALALRRPASPGPRARLLRNLALATAPVLAAGFLLRFRVEDTLRDPVVIAAATIGFGVLLLLADRRRARRELSAMDWRHALLIGVAQIFALIPGASRSGVTLSAALLAGFSRVEAARFSFLLSIPVILAAAALKAAHLAALPRVEWGVLAFGTALSALCAYACIALFLRLIERVGMLPFVVYRVLLGLAILVVFL